MSKELILIDDKFEILMPANPNKVIKSRIGQYIEWMIENKLPWFKPDLIGYRDYLLSINNPNSTSSKLSTIRSRYEALTRQRDLFYDLLPPHITSISDRKSAVDETIQRIKDAINPIDTKVDVTEKQDTEASEHIRLTIEQANRLLSKPDTSTLMGLRNKAIIALMLATGIREFELSNLDIDDLRVLSDDNSLCLRVKQGKGNKSRLIPYGQMVEVLSLIDRWLEAARIEDGPLFRGFYKGDVIRPDRLSERAIQYILADYKIVISGKETSVRPHDLRRSYAKLMSNSGMLITAIRDNLGHTDIRTTQGYIGKSDMSDRQPSLSLNFE